MSLVKVQGNASGTGTLTIAAPNTNSNYTLTLPTNTGTLLTDSNSSQAGVFATLSVNSNNISADNSLGFRNRIINGDMRIDQRNAGASVSFNSSGNFPVDRFKTYNTVGSGSTAQRSTTVPSGFNNSIVFTVGTGASPGAADECRFFQSIEGFNAADLGFGTASAQSVTVSFWVRSSITGTYAFNLRNDAGNRSYVATYSINAANTWEYKTTTIAGDTSGTWETGSSAGIMLRFDLGSGSNANTTAGAWQAGNYGRTSGSVNWIATNGATFYITGVQLEAGSVATPFERRSYGQELMLCQRYYQKSYNVGTAPASNTEAGVSRGYFYSGVSGANTAHLVLFKVSMRATPSVSLWDVAGTANRSSAWNSANTRTDGINSGSLGAQQIGENSFAVNEANIGAYWSYGCHWAASVEL